MFFLTFQVFYGLNLKVFLDFFLWVFVLFALVESRGFLGF